MRPTQKDKGRTFRDLHARERAFVIPNPWDAGSARLLEALGFEALATTSSGFAYSLGRWDGEVTLDEKIEHCRALTAATSLPVSADLENGFDHRPEGVAKAVRRIAESGVVGASIEDWSGDESIGIYELHLAVERVAAAVEAARGLDLPFTLTARAENLLRGRPDLDDTMARLSAYEAAGADVLYAPALKTLAEVRAVVAAVSRPVNVLCSTLPGATVADLESAGARRISVGGAMAFASVGPVVEAAGEILEHGTFGWLESMLPSARLKKILGA